MARARTLGVIGGSGLYAMGELREVARHSIDTPFGAPSAELVEAELDGARLLFLPRHGTDHALAAHEVNYRANVYAMKALGAGQLLGVSAVGSLRADMAPGDVVLVDQFIDRTRARASTYFEGHGVVAHTGFADPVDAALRDAVADVARIAGATVHNAGTYVCIDGPQFSSRAESALHRQWGADVVGMTNLPEARLAREAELPYASLCLVTDFDVWHQTEAPVAVRQVLAQVQANAFLAARIVRDLLRCLPDPSRSEAAYALDDALLTPPSRISAAARNVYGVLLERVLRARLDASQRTSL